MDLYNYSPYSFVAQKGNIIYIRVINVSNILSYDLLCWCSFMTILLPLIKLGAIHSSDTYIGYIIWEGL